MPYRSRWAVALCLLAAACTLDRAGALVNPGGPVLAGASSSSTTASAGGATSAGSTTSSASSNGGSGGGGGGGGAGGSGGAPLTCPAGSTGDVSDDFNGAVLDVSKWKPWARMAPHAGVIQASGLLQLWTDGVGDAYSGIDSVWRGTLKNCRLSVQIVTSLGGAPEARTWFGVFQPGGNDTGIGIGTAGSEMHAFHHEMATALVDDTIIPSAAWGRIVDDGSAVHWLISDDGTAWKEVRTAPRPAILDGMLYIELGAGEIAPVTAATAVLDNVITK